MVRLMTARGRLVAAVSGTIAVAICCFTPVLVVAFTAIGLAALTPYLDYVLIPSLILLLFISWRAYHEYTRAESKRRPRP